MAAVGLVALAGIWSAMRLPLDAVPDITNNQVQIITSCPSLAAQEVEQYVTYPIEQNMANLPNLVELRSISRFGLSVVTVVFTDNTDIYFARQLINEHLKAAETEIPDGIGKPELAPVTTGLGEIFQYVLHPKEGSEAKYTAMDLRTLQDWVVARQLYGTKGVAEVNSFGGLLKQYEVALDPDKLLAMNVSVLDIFSALERNNQNTGGAYIDKKPNAYFIRGIGTLSGMDDIRKVAIRRNANGTPLLVGDVAKVQLGSAVRYGALTYNGEKEAVGGMVLMLKGENSFDVVGRVKEKIKAIQKSLPKDVVIEPYLDRTNLIKRAIATVEKNLVEGALIVIFVLVLFLGNLRAGLIVASAIPLSMLFALWMMRLFGVSANLMSLGAIDFGLIVDGAVIIVEATLHQVMVHSHMKSQPQAHSAFGIRQSMDDIVRKSASKMMNSAAFGQIIILIVYLPILSLEGIEGKMFRPMAQTVGFAIIGALLLSLTYIPVLCTWLLPKELDHEKKTMADRFMGFLQKLYEPLLAAAIRFKYLVTGAALALLLFAGILFSRMGGEFIPTLQEGDYNFDYILPQGASLSQTLETSMQAARMLDEFPEVKMVIGKTGTSEIPMDVMPTEGTDMIVVLKDVKNWKTTHDYWELGRLMTQKLQSIPGVFVEQSQPIQMRFNDLMTGVTQDVAVKIFGENLDTLASYAEHVASVVQTIEGTGEPKVQRITGLPQITIEYDRTKMAQYGVDVQTINQIISTAFAGQSAGVIFENERRFDLVVRLDSLHRNDIGNIKNLYVPLLQGGQVPLSEVATVAFKEGPAEIGREDGKRRIVIGFNLKGRDVQSVVEELQQKLNQQVKLPTAYYFTYGGTFENLQKATNRLLIALPIALALIFVLLYFALRSFKQAALVFSAIPMSAIGGVFALLLRGMPFSISAGIGFIALFGVAVLNGIVLISTFNDLSKQGYVDLLERVKEGTRLRLRPVLMTAAVASLGFLPMALATGTGAEVQRPLATVVIGGLITATLLTLILLPILYLIFNNTKKSGMGGQQVVVPLLFFLLLNAKSLNAQRVLSIEEVIALGMENNLGLKTDDALIDKSKQQIKLSNELEKTGIFIENEDLSPNAPQGILKVGVSQTFDFPTVYGAKKKWYEAQAQAGALAKERSKAELRRELRKAYYALWYVQEKTLLYNRLDSLYGTLSNIAELRSRTGETAPIERMAAKAQQQLASNRLEQWNKEVVFWQLRIMQLTNTKEAYMPPLDKLEKIAYAIAGPSESPEISWQRQQVEVSATEKRLLQQQNLPDFSARLFSQRLYGISDNPLSGFSVSINLPLLSKPKQKIALANKEIVVQERMLEETTNNVAAQQRQMRALIEKAGSSLLFYETTGLAQAKAIENSALLAYRSGEVSYADMLQYFIQSIDTQQEYLDKLNEYNQVVIEYLFVSGN